MNAVANDAAVRAASADAPPLEVIEAEARQSLGEVGSSATFAWSTDDADGDGDADTVVLEVVARASAVHPAVDRRRHRARRDPPHGPGAHASRLQT